MSDLRQFLRQLLSGFMHGIGWRASRMIPAWLVLVILIVALILGIDWKN